jgi:hypothetical protein
MTAIYRYKQTTDNGMAPCVDRGLVTLATCKPNVRRQARPGDWVVGFRSVAQGAPVGVVIWAGRVAESLEVGDYERQHRGRSDAVYRALPAGGFRRLRPDYHPDERQFLRDTLHPVLTFDRNTAWYFGSVPVLLPERLMHLAPGLRDRDFLVNGVSDGDAEALEEWLRSLGASGGFAGPRDPARTKHCGC